MERVKISIILIHFIHWEYMGSDIWALSQENLILLYANNNGKDQPSHPCKLITTFVICLLESILSKLATYAKVH